MPTRHSKDTLWIAFPLLVRAPVGSDLNLKYDAADDQLGLGLRDGRANQIGDLLALHIAMVLNKITGF